MCLNALRTMDKSSADRPGTWVGPWERRGAAHTPKRGCGELRRMAVGRSYEGLCLTAGEDHISEGHDMIQTLNTSGVWMVSNQI